MGEEIFLPVAFCTINIATEGSPKSRLCPTPIELRQWFFIVHCTIYSTAHSRAVNSLKHCICTTSMINIRPGRDSNPVPLSFDPKPDSTSGAHQQTRDVDLLLTKCSWVCYMWKKTNILRHTIIILCILCIMTGKLQYYLLAEVN